MQVLKPYTANKLRSREILGIARKPHYFLWILDTRSTIWTSEIKGREDALRGTHWDTRVQDSAVQSANNRAHRTPRTLEICASSVPLSKVAVTSRRTTFTGECLFLSRPPLSIPLPSFPLVMQPYTSGKRFHPTVKRPQFLLCFSLSFSSVWTSYYITTT